MAIPVLRFPTTCLKQVTIGSAKAWTPGAQSVQYIEHYGNKSPKKKCTCTTNPMGKVSYACLKSSSAYNVWPPKKIPCERETIKHAMQYERLTGTRLILASTNSLKVNPPLRCPSCQHRTMVSIMLHAVTEHNTEFSGTRCVPGNLSSG